MAYEEWDRGNGVFEVRIKGGKTVTIVERDDGKWIVREDPEHRVFSEHGDALNLARELGGDLDL